MRTSLRSIFRRDHISRTLKVYMTDIGLLVAMHGFDMKKEIYDNSLKGPAKGGIYENLIADIC